MEKPPVVNENGGTGAPEKTPAPEVPAPKAKSKPDYVLWVGVAIAIALIVYEIVH